MTGERRCQEHSNLLRSPARKNTQEQVGLMQHVNQLPMPLPGRRHHLYRPAESSNQRRLQLGLWLRPVKLVLRAAQPVLKGPVAHHFEREQHSRLRRQDHRSG
jgi:hypothetical protein